MNTKLNVLTINEAKALMVQRQIKANKIGKGASSEKFSLTHKNIRVWRSLYSNNQAAAMEMLADFKFIDNEYRFIITKFAEYVGMPEFRFFNDEYYRNAIRYDGIETIIDFLLTINLDEVPDTSKALNSHLKTRLRHNCMEKVVKLSSDFYPRMSRYYLAERLKAYKSGVIGLIRNYSDDEIRQAIASSNEKTHKISLSMHKNKNIMHVNKGDYQGLRNAFTPGGIAGFDNKSRKKEQELLFETATEDILDDWIKRFSNDTIEKFIFARFCRRESLSSTNEQIKVFFANKGITDNNSIIYYIGSTKAKIYDFFKANFADHVNLAGTALEKKALSWKLKESLNETALLNTVADRMEQQARLKREHEVVIDSIRNNTADICFPGTATNIAEMDKLLA